ncbi:MULTISPECIES: hypothetical protein [Aphanothece]|uniref:hypothetical protein n=1 Tax=Aphanothece TaxID=1121 RepID=UPI0039856ABA
MTASASPATMVDACMTVWGKPFQTAATLLSLFSHSSELIDRIYIVVESQQPQGFSISALESLLPDALRRKLVFYQPKYFLAAHRTDYDRCLVDADYRLSVRYQYGLESTDKAAMLILHNDVEFFSCPILPILHHLKDYAGIGEIGQCWNCPAFQEERCAPLSFQEFIDSKPAYSEVKRMILRHPKLGAGRSFKLIKNGLWPRDQPLPMPECRLNEFCCLVDADIYRKEVIPHGTIPPIGSSFFVDTGDRWFREMVLNGYKFKHHSHPEWKHGYVANRAGFTTKTVRGQQDANTQYVLGEQAAKNHLYSKYGVKPSKSYFPLEE